MPRGGAVISACVENVRKNLAALLKDLSVVAIGTRDAGMRPECVLTAGVTLGPSPGRLTVWVPETGGERTFANLAENGSVAVVLEEAGTHRTVQVKGRCVEVRPATEADREAVQAASEAFGRQLMAVGLPAPVVRRRRTWPCRAVVVDAGEVFEQTPGPDAGCPFPRPAAG